MKQPYQAPRIVDERSLEAEAMACNKVPGWTSGSFCGQVWAAPSGVASTDCYLNADARSS